MQKLIMQTPSFTIEVTGETENEVIKQAAFWLSLPTDCRQCGKPLILDYRTPKTFEYYELRCTGTPSHSVNLGERMGSHKLYFDDKKPWKIYDPTAIDPNDRVRTVTDPATNQPTPATPRAISNGSHGSGDNANIGARKNDLIKLIRECQNRRIATGITQGDVAGMSIEIIEGHISSLFGMLEGAAQ